EVNAEGQATLRGQVADEDQRKLAAAYVRLEPGVRSVVNELSVP
ncbi:MAG: BON domain-containing protein, partial [Planctomycetaceae bacterium]|nr:BON domain-containing protein [Planctomycetaceae bacterium]